MLRTSGYPKHSCGLCCVPCGGERRSCVGRKRGNDSVLGVVRFCRGPYGPQARRWDCGRAQRGEPARSSESCVRPPQLQFCTSVENVDRGCATAFWCATSCTDCVWLLFRLEYFRTLHYSVGVLEEPLSDCSSLNCSSGLRGPMHCHSVYRNIVNGSLYFFFGT